MERQASRALPSYTTMGDGHRANEHQPVAELAGQSGAPTPDAVDDRPARPPLRSYAFVTLLNLAVWGAVTWQLRDPTRGAFRIDLPPTPSFPPTLEAVGTPTARRLVLHVAGAVRKPGLVRLSEGARIADAVTAAGGFTDDADRALVNLASPVLDGAMLVVPSVDDAVGDTSMTGVQAAPGLQTLTQPPLSAMGLEDPQPGPGASLPGASGVPQRLNINTATAADLEALPGIGPALAARIVAHRESSGPFRAPDDLLAVSGIGQAVLDKISDLVRVE